MDHPSTGLVNNLRVANAVVHFELTQDELMGLFREVITNSFLFSEKPSLDIEYTPMEVCSDICGICLEEDKIGYVQLKCKHTFHENCIKQWKHNSCPMCRKSMCKKTNLPSGGDVISLRNL